VVVTAKGVKIEEAKDRDIDRPKGYIQDCLMQVISCDKSQGGGSL